MQRTLKAVSSAPGAAGCLQQRRAARRTGSRGPGLAPVVCVLVGCGALPPPRAPSDPGPPEAPVTSEPELAVRPSPEAPPAAEPELGWLSPGHVGAAVRARQDDFQACHLLEDLDSRREDGAVTVGWLVRSDGGVNDVQLGRSTYESPRMNDCVLAVARQVTFPRSAGPTSVSWTVRFRGAPAAAVAAAAASP